MNKPIIGITPLWDSPKNSIWMLPGYQQGIEAAGGIPLILPLTEDRESLLSILGIIDGILFTGGHDISPKLYNQTKSEFCSELCPTRDTMETVLFTEGVLNQSKPAFGICRGLQFFNAILGGTLYQDIPSQMPAEISHQQKPPYDEPIHSVSITPDTPLHQLLSCSTLMVNSYHHQAIHKLAPLLTAMATAPDGITEAVYMKEKPFVWAVQWHPEFALNHPASQKLFHTFIQSCSSYY